LKNNKSKILKHALSPTLSPYNKKSQYTVKFSSPDIENYDIITNGKT
jgi:hypothetical protein